MEAEHARREKPRVLERERETDRIAERGRASGREKGCVWIRIFVDCNEGGAITDNVRVRLGMIRCLRLGEWRDIYGL